MGETEKVSTVCWLALNHSLAIQFPMCFLLEASCLEAKPDYKLIRSLK